LFFLSFWAIGNQSVANIYATDQLRKRFLEKNYCTEPVPEKMCCMKRDFLLRILRAFFCDFSAIKNTAEARSQIKTHQLSITFFLTAKYAEECTTERSGQA